MKDENKIEESKLQAIVARSELDAEQSIAESTDFPLLRQWL